MVQHLTLLNFGVTKAPGDPVSQWVFPIFVNQIYEENTGLRDMSR